MRMIFPCILMHLLLIPVVIHSNEIKYLCGHERSVCTELQLELGENSIIQLQSSHIISTNDSVNFDFLYSIHGDLPSVNLSHKVIDSLPSVSIKPNNRTSTVINLVTKDVGQLDIGLLYNHKKWPNLMNSTTLQISIVHHSWIVTMNAVIGWIYFAAWSISFYPQVWLNFSRKSVEGLNFDFLVYNLLGFLCYAIYNTLEYFSPIIQHEYNEVHPWGVLQVQIQDVVFALHALVLTILVSGQVFIYERAGQSVSYPCMGITTLCVLYNGVLCILVGTGTINWLFLIQNGLSYTKVFLTFIKYMPQAYMNYQRKSTDGWSIYNILLDFTGGSFSLAQIFLQSYNFNDYESITGDAAKFALSVFSIMFDVLFMVQHYCLYRKPEDLDENSDRRDLIDSPGNANNEDRVNYHNDDYGVL